MFARGGRGGFLLLACVVGIFMFHPALADDSTPLPSQELQNAIRELPVMAKEERTTPESPYLTLQVNLDRTASTDQGRVWLDHEGTARVPFVMPNIMILQFEPSVSADQIQSYVQKPKPEGCADIPRDRGHTGRG